MGWVVLGGLGLGLRFYCLVPFHPSKFWIAIMGWGFWLGDGFFFFFERRMNLGFLAILDWGFWFGTWADSGIPQLLDSEFGYIGILSGVGFLVWDRDLGLCEVGLWFCGCPPTSWMGTWKFHFSFHNE